MGGTQAILDFGRWIASRPSGTARLGCSAGPLQLDLMEGKIVGVTGPDRAALVDKLGVEPADGENLITAAEKTCSGGNLNEIQAVGAVKSLLLNSLKAWFLDPNRTFSASHNPPQNPSSHSISPTHAVVELVLSSQDDGLADVILPDRNVLLTRTEGFLDLYAPLGLSEEADLIVAKITGQRTGEEIQTHSPHPKEEVGRLLAALVAAGMLSVREPDPPAIGIHLTPEPQTTPEDDDDGASRSRRLSPLVLFVPIVVFVVIIAAVWWFVLRDDSPAPAASSSAWGIAVDLGCEPHEYRRLLQVARVNDNVQPIAVTEANDGGEGCWRLVWGRFATAAEAHEAFADVPAGIRREGFELHAVEIPADESSGFPGD